MQIYTLLPGTIMTIVINNDDNGRVMGFTAFTAGATRRMTRLLFG
jgi:uncharacterized protein YuzE